MQQRNTGKKHRNPQWTAERAKRELTEWQASGETKAAFAQSRGYFVKQLGNWEMRLRTQGWTVETGQLTTPALIPIRVVDSNVGFKRSNEPASGIEVELPCGIVVRIHPNFSTDMLSEVLQVVRQC